MSFTFLKASLLKNLVGRVMSWDGWCGYYHLFSFLIANLITLCSFYSLRIDLVLFDFVFVGVSFECVRLMLAVYIFAMQRSVWAHYVCILLMLHFGSNKITLCRKIQVQEKK